MNMGSFQYKVSGMTCTKCVKKISAALKNSPLDISNINVSLNNSLVSFKNNQDIDLKQFKIIFSQKSLAKYSVATYKKSLIGDILSFCKKLYPLFLIFGYLILVTLTVAIINNNFSMHSLMSHYMGGFFIVFSFFKLLNLKGFVEAFQTYDPFAKKWTNYGYLYVFLELTAGLIYLFNPLNLTLNIAVILILTSTSLGVIQVLKQKQSIQCACLGTIFNLPMTYVTLFENLIMIIMAIVMAASALI